MATRDREKMMTRQGSAERENLSKEVIMVFGVVSLHDGSTAIATAAQELPVHTA